MTDHFSLDQRGYSFLEKEKIWIRPEYAGIAYSDGDEVERRLADIIAAATDCSVLSRELCQHITDWPSRYHLSQLRANLLRPFAALLRGKTVLEIGAGMGALSRYLGESGAEVLALEGSPRRAAIARSRTRELPNVTVICEDFNAFQFPEQFDIITLIGVLEYAPLFSTGDEPARRMLEKVRGLLKPGGQLLLAIENQLGLKYFAGAAEDHLGQPMYGLEGRYREGQPRTFGRKKLAELLVEAGFAGQEFFAPFPDYKLPVSIVSEQGFTHPLFDASAFAWQSWRFDPQLPPYKNFSLEFVWPEIIESGLGLDLANSFLIRAQTGKISPFASETLAWHYGGSSRQPAFCKETRFVCKNEEITVHYQPFSDLPPPSSTLLSFRLADSAIYYPGVPLSYSMMSLVTRDDWSLAEFISLLRHYLDILEKFIVALGLPPVKIDSVNTLLPGQCLDLIPQNIMSLPQGEWRVIDQEWNLHQEISTGYMLFRVIRNLVSDITHCGHCVDQAIINNFDLLAVAFSVVGGRLAEEQLAVYLELEEKVQGVVSGYPVSMDAAWGQRPLPNQLLHQYVISQNDSIAELNLQLADRDAVIAEKNAILTEKNAQIANVTSQIVAIAKQTDTALGELEQKLIHHPSEPVYIDRVSRERRFILRRVSPRLRKECKALRQSPGIGVLLNQEWYQKHYPEITGVPAVQHYVFYGATEGKDPNPYFHTNWYLRKYLDVAAEERNPLLHFIQHCVSEGRKPNPYFDTDWYVRQYPQSEGHNPLAHYIEKWRDEGVNPNPFFDTAWYAHNYPDALVNGSEPLLHYLVFGAKEGKKPHPLFDNCWYLRQYPRAAECENPLLHFLLFGEVEKLSPNPYFDREWYVSHYKLNASINPFLHYLEHGLTNNPSPYFDTTWYLKTYPNVAETGMNPLAHYVEYGWKEGCNANFLFDCRWYLQQYPDIFNHKLEPLAHYWQYGEKEGRKPSRHFDPLWYARKYPEAIGSDCGLLGHFLEKGLQQGYDPSPYFNTKWFTETYPESISSGVPPFLYFLEHGEKENLAPHEHCSCKRYYYRSDYERFLDEFYTVDAKDAAIMTNDISRFTAKPLISIVMPVYNPEPRFLEEAIDSVLAQVYPHWELCIADDHSTNPAIREILERYQRADQRIKVVFRTENGHISKASNSALQLATGDYIALLDHDDLLTKDALFWVAATLEDHKQAGIIYSDEDKIDASGTLQDPYFKPDWNPLLFFGHNLINHFGVYRASLIQDIGGFRAGYEGSQDYDLAARCVNRISAEEIVHIPRVLYHWRMAAGSTSIEASNKGYAQTASEKAINELLTIQKIPAAVHCDSAVGYMHSLDFLPPAVNLKISIIIPSKNHRHILSACITSIISKTHYPNYEIIVVDNGSNEPETLDYLKELSRVENIRIVHGDFPFNFSRLVNLGAAAATGDILVLLNDDTEVISENWLTEMAAIVALTETGAVGAKLFYPDGTIQHAGVVLGIGKGASHIMGNFPSDAAGYFGWLKLTRNCSVVTAACLAIRKELYQRMGGFDERHFTVGLNDVDFCIRLNQHGYRNAWTPKAILTHHESKSRGTDIYGNEDKQKRFWNEMSHLKKIHPTCFSHDPFYNPNLALDRVDCVTALKPRTVFRRKYRLDGVDRQLKSFFTPGVNDNLHILIVLPDRNSSRHRIVGIAERLRQKGSIASYTITDNGGVFQRSAEAMDEWVTAIFVSGDMTGNVWFKQNIEGIYPYLIDWTQKIDAKNKKYDQWNPLYQQIAHSAGLITENEAVLTQLEQHCSLDLREWSAVMGEKKNGGSEDCYSPLMEMLSRVRIPAMPASLLTDIK